MKKIMQNERLINIILSIFIVVVAMGSYFVIAPKASSLDYQMDRIAILDKKEANVVALAAAATATSVAITMIPEDVPMIPDDFAMPIANELADLSIYFVIISCTILLEKYLLTIIGSISFGYIIPICCIIALIARLLKNVSIETLAYKTAILGLAIYLVVPTSIWFSNQIENTYQESINHTLEVAEGVASTIQTEIKIEENKGFVSSFVDSFKNGVSNVTGAIGDALDGAKRSLSNFIEAIAVLLVTSCAIPLLVLSCYMKIVNIIFNTNLHIPSKNEIRATRLDVKEKMTKQVEETKKLQLTNSDE